MTDQEYALKMADKYEIERLRADNERLRAALSWIDTFDPETIAAAETKFGNLISGVEQKP